MAETPKVVGFEMVEVSRQDSSLDHEFELYEKGEPKDLGEAIGLAVGAASMTWPVIGGVFRDAKAKRISDQLQDYVEGTLEGQGHRIAELELENRTLNSALVEQETGWRPPPQVPPQLATALGMVVAEFMRAKAKHGDKCIDGPGYTETQRLAVLVEEVGEVAHELTYDSAPAGIEGGDTARLMAEVVQVAAMAAGWLSALVPGETEAPRPGPEMPAEAAALIARVTGTLQGSGLAVGKLKGDSSTAGRRVNVSADGPSRPQFLRPPAARRMEGYEAGSTVRVPSGMVALMVPRERLDAAVDAVLKADGAELNGPGGQA